MAIQNIFVVGSGLMGSGIAQTALQYGYEVILNDQSKAALERGQAGISARVALCSSGDTFTPHGSVGELKRLLELDGAGLAQRAMEVLRFDKTAAGC